MVAVDKAGTLPAVTAEEIARDLAWCLGRFLDATADEIVMQRAKQSLALWEALKNSDDRTIDLTLLAH